MSRSKKKEPCGGVAGTTGQKLFRRQEHKAERTKVKQKLNTVIYLKDTDIKEDIDVLLPHPKEYGNEWASPRDGKTYWTRWKEPLTVWLKETLKDVKDFMRK